MNKRITLRDLEQVNFAMAVLRGTNEIYDKYDERYNMTRKEAIAAMEKVGYSLQQLQNMGMIPKVKDLI